MGIVFIVNHMPLGTAKAVCNCGLPTQVTGPLGRDLSPHPSRCATRKPTEHIILVATPIRAMMMCINRIVLLFRHVLILDPTTTVAANLVQLDVLRHVDRRRAIRLAAKRAQLLDITWNLIGQLRCFLHLALGSRILIVLHGVLADRRLAG